MTLDLDTAAANDEPVALPSPPEAPSAAAPASDSTDDEAASRRYLAAVEALLDDAFAHRRVPMLADTLAWTLARVVHAYGNAATGDILKRLGGYLNDLDERERARKEAEAARKQGRALN